MTLVTRFPSWGLSLHICNLRVEICKTPQVLLHLHLFVLAAYVFKLVFLL